MIHTTRIVVLATLVAAGSANATDCFVGCGEIGIPIVVVPAPSPIDLTVTRNYSTAANSPLPLGDPLYFLEDFEDGEFDTPGFRERFISFVGPTDVYRVEPNWKIEPGGLSDDAEDREPGRAIKPPWIAETGEFIFVGGGPTHPLPVPATSKNVFGSMSWDFGPLPDGASDGALPTEVGFALSGAPPGTEVRVTLYEENFGGSHQGILQIDSEAAETPLLVTTSLAAGIATVAVSFQLELPLDTETPTAPFEIDHVQYGYAVPEAASVWLVAWAVSVLASFRRHLA